MWIKQTVISIKGHCVHDVPQAGTGTWFIAYYHHITAIIIINLENGSAYLAGTNTLAGGTLKFNKGLQNLIEKALVPVDWAINMATLNPAKYLNVADRKGKLCAGYDADIVVLDKDYEIVQVFYRGKMAK